MGIGYIHHMKVEQQLVNKLETAKKSGYKKVKLADGNTPRPCDVYSLSIDHVIEKVNGVNNGEPIPNAVIKTFLEKVKKYKRFEAYKQPCMWSVINLD